MVMEENRQFGYLNPCTDDTVIRQKSGQVVAGGAWAFITPLIPMVFIFIYAVSTFRSGMLQSFENPSDAYVWYCGKWVSKFMDIFSIIMITGIAFGPEAGFLTGAVSAFASNFFFSQGPWTPWQMFAYGFGGFFAGLIFHRHRQWAKPWLLAPFGFLTILLIVGPMLDTCTVFTMLTKFTRKNVLAVYAAGVMYNVNHGIGAALTLLFVSHPLLSKLDRLQTKYGILEI